MSELNHPLAIIGILSLFVVAIKTILDFASSKKKTDDSSPLVDREALHEFRAYHVKAAEVQLRILIILEELVSVQKDRAERIEELHRDTATSLGRIESALTQIKQARLDIQRRDR